MARLNRLDSSISFSSRFLSSLILRLRSVIRRLAMKTGMIMEIAAITATRRKGNWLSAGGCQSSFGATRISQAPPG
ncbi:hypothetical protein D3C87_1840410 [compost metagenome]